MVWCVTYCLDSGLSFMNPLLLTIDFYCYGAGVHEGTSTEPCQVSAPQVRAQVSAKPEISKID